MRKLKIIFFALCATSICGCDNIFQEKDDPELSQQTPSPNTEPYPDSQPQEDKTPSSRSPNDANPEGSEALPANDLEPIYELTLSETKDETNFSAWLNTAEGTALIAQVGKYKHNENELNLHRDTLISYSTFAHERPLRIRTHGHHLTLVGHSMSNLFVETHAEGKPSGNVIVYLTSSDLPTINAEGKDGSSGANAECSGSKNTCVEVSDRTTRRTQLHERFEWREELREQRFGWNDSSVHPDFRTAIQKHVAGSSPDVVRNSICETGTTINMYISEPELSGELTLHQTIRFPVPQSPLQEDLAPDAQLVAGGDGEDGQNAGNVRIFQLSNEARIRESIVRGGRPGRGGMNLKIPAAKEAEEIVLDSEVISEAFSLQNLVAKRNVVATCASEIGGNPRKVFRVITEAFKSPFVHIKTSIQLDKHTLKILARAAGEDIDPQSPEMALSGAEGKSAFAKWSSVASWAAWRKLIPNDILLPIEAINQSANSISPERFSGAVFGLRTLPL